LDSIVKLKNLDSKLDEYMKKGAVKKDTEAPGKIFFFIIIFNFFLLIIA
jgi:hypothetical protein